MLRSRSAPAFALALCFALASACEGPDCVDLDGDGLGQGCMAGADCDDTHAGRGEDCVSVPAPDCDLAPTATGCPCVPSSVTACFNDDPALAGIGICTTGRSSCLNGHWGLCVGSASPTFERCDGRDEDCDGQADEGVRSPCGGCDPSCQGGVWGDPFEADEGELVVTDSGALTLPRDPVQSATLWVSNAGEATLSRIDAALATETARYSTGTSLTLEPSRVAVDWNGDAWVANRAFVGVSSLLRVAADASRCLDADLNGLDTSTGPSDVRAFGGDECVRLAVDVGAEAEVARALAIDGDRGLDGASGGNPWVGLHEGHAVVEVDGLDGRIIRRVELPSFSPYAAAFDPWGTLWMASRDGLLARIDPSTDPATVQILEVPLPCWLLYGLAIDEAGRLAISGFSCDQVATYEPWTGHWRFIRSAPSPRGVAIREGRLLVAHTAGLMSEVNLVPLGTRRMFGLEALGVSPIESVGAAVDSLGHAWAISSQGGEGGMGVASRVDLETGLVDAQVTVGLAPHVQGDLTGARRTGEPRPEASATHVFEGCGADEPTQWLRLHGTLDRGTRGEVELAVRHASSRAALASAAFDIIATFGADAFPVELTLPEGGVVEVRVILRIEGSLGLPRLFGLGLEHRCPGPD